MNIYESTVKFLSKNNISVDLEKKDLRALSQLDFRKNKPKIICLDTSIMGASECSLCKEIIDSNNYIVEENDGQINAIDKNIWQIIQSILTQPKAETTIYKEKLNIINKDLTVVTGLWNIGRPNRSFETYLDHFDRILKTPVFMYIYVPPELEDFVWARRDKENTVVKLMSLDDLKVFYGNFWIPTQTIRKDPNWRNQAEWLKESPQAKCEWYNPIVQSKMPLLHDAKIFNPFNTNYFIWLDAGISTTTYENFFVQDRVLDKINKYLDSMLFLSYPYVADKEIHGFDFQAINKYAGKKVEYVCRGGLFGGHKDYISSANAMYWNLLNSSLSEGYMGTEESIFSIMAHLDPMVYKRYALDENGLICKFIQNLIADKVELEPFKPTYNGPVGYYNPICDKTSLYVLGFNFPEQFQTLLNSFEKHPEWLSRPRKILVNNSDNPSNIQQYDEICKKYNFEHIITGKNLGICGGRQFVAEHFDKSDSKYYMFFEDDMCLHDVNLEQHCRNGFRCYIPNLYDKIHHILAKGGFDYLKISFTEVYMDNNLQVAWYNVPQTVRTKVWPNYDQLPINGLDYNCPRTEFKNIDSYEGLSFAIGNIYYANWPMLIGKTGNKKMFLDTKWGHPYEQTWMSQIFQDHLEGKYHSAVLLASPINHNRISHYKPEQRRENAG